MTENGQRLGSGRGLAFRLALWLMAFYIVATACEPWSRGLVAVIRFMAPRVGLLGLAAFFVLHLIVAPRVLRAGETKEMKLRDLLVVVGGIGAIVVLGLVLLP